MPASLAKQKALAATWPTVLDRIAGGESLRSICEDGRMPALRTVMKWLEDDRETESGESMVQQYARARELQAEHHASELLDIADDARNDWMEKTLNNGQTVQVLDKEHVQRSKLRIDTRKWIASKLLPKVYGDRIDISGHVEVSSTIQIGALMSDSGHRVTDGLSNLTPAQLGTAQVVTAEVVDSSREECGKDEVDVAPDSSGDGESESNQGEG